MCKHDNPFLKAFSLVPEMDRSSVNGAILVSGWTIPVGYTNVRTVSADMWDAHHKGADAVTELALVLARCSESSFKSGQL